MDGHRRYAEEDPEPSWYAGQRPADGTDSYTAPSRSAGSWDSESDGRPGGAFRLPEQRPADPYATSGSHSLPPADSGVIRVPVRGPEYPTVRPSGDAKPATTYRSDPLGAPPPSATFGVDTPASPAPAVSFDEPTSLVPTARAGTGTGSRFAGGPKSRPVSAVIFAIVTAVLLVPAVLLLVRTAFAADPAAGGVVPAILLTLGLPLTGFGLFSLAAAGDRATGGDLAAGDRATGLEAWLRPPLAYLPVGLILLLAAGLGAA